LKWGGDVIGDSELLAVGEVAVEDGGFGPVEIPAVVDGEDGVVAGEKAG